MPKPTFEKNLPTDIKTGILEKIIQGINDGILIIDEDYNITFANDTLYRLFSRDRTQSSRKCYDFFYHYDAPCDHFIKGMICPNREIKSGKLSCTERIYKSSSETGKIFNITTSPIADEHGRIQYMKVLRDITNKFMTEGALKESEIKYRNLVDSALIGVYRTNLRGDILFVNKALANMMDFDSPEEMIKGNVLLRYKDPGDRELLIKSLKETGNINRVELETVTKKNNTRTILLSATLEDKVLTGMIMDITERKQLDDLAKNQDTLFSSMLDGMSDCMIVVNREFEILYANNGYLRQTSISADSIKGRRCYEISHCSKQPCYLAAEECSVKTVFETGSRQKTIHTNPGPNKKPLYIETIAYPLKDHHGNIISAVKRVHNITHKIKLEEELRNRIDELEEFYEMAVGRELKMIELKNEIEKLNIELNRYKCHDTASKNEKTENSSPALKSVIAQNHVTDAGEKENKLIQSKDAFFNMLKDLDGTFKEVKGIYEDLIMAFSNIIDAKSHWTRGHSIDTTKYATAIARELRLSHNDIETLKTASLLHDIGKIGTYDKILDKPATLSNNEASLIRLHPLRGEEMLMPIKGLKKILPIIRSHHEKFDGSGYPDGLKGYKIPFLARILCVADSYDAMVSDRPYRTSRGINYALSELQRCSETQFDPEVVSAFTRVLEKENQTNSGLPFIPRTQN